MIKKRKDKLIFSSVFIHIFILVCGIFSFSILFGGIVSGGDTTTPIPTDSGATRALKPTAEGSTPLFGLGGPTISAATSPGWFHLVQGFQWALSVVAIIQLVGNLAGADQAQNKALSIAAFGGIMSEE